MTTVECPECQGDGVIIEAGSCGGGCEFCPPGRRCEVCKGTGEVERDDVEPEAEEPTS